MGAHFYIHINLWDKREIHDVGKYSQVMILTLQENISILNNWKSNVFSFLLVTNFDKIKLFCASQTLMQVIQGKWFKNIVSSKGKPFLKKITYKCSTYYIHIQRLYYLILSILLKGLIKVNYVYSILINYFYIAVSYHFYYC